MAKRRRESKVPTTMKQIAERCGVSRWTVAAVLFPTKKNAHVGCSEELRKKIVAAAEGLNYRPNRASRSLRSQRHNQVGVLLRNTHAIPGDWMGQLLVTAQLFGVTVLFAVAKPGEEAEALFFRENVVDGVLLFEDLGPAVDEAIERCGLHAVYVNTNRFDRRAVVNLDERGSMRVAVEHLAERGRRHPILILNGEGRYNTLREEGFREAVRKENLNGEVMRLPAMSQSAEQYERQARGIAERLAATPRIGSAIVHQDCHVRTVYHICRSQGRRIPQEIAVIGIHTAEPYAYDPTLTTFNRHRGAGMVGLYMLRDLIEGRQVKPVLLDSELQVGGST